MTTIGVSKGDTRSLDNGSYDPSSSIFHFKGSLVKSEARGALPSRSKPVFSRTNRLRHRRPFNTFFEPDAPSRMPSHRHNQGCS